MSSEAQHRIAIRGLGLVTPLGNTVDEVWPQLMQGVMAKAEPVPGALRQPEGRTAWYFPVGLKPFDTLGRIPRIRRSSAISYFSVAAGLQALGIGDPRATALEPARAAKTAVIFAICSGGVHYTRRFYEKVVAEGAQAASPLLFPETVYNAPASHLSALLGIDGESYTLVGDATVGLSALAFAGELLACQPELEECVVVGAEECDWILWEGYHAWRLLSGNPEVTLHRSPSQGMILAEGGAAIVVGRSRGEKGEITVGAVRTGSYRDQADAAPALASMLGEIGGDRQPRFVVGSANGTWVDRSEAAALRGNVAEEAPRFYPKAFLGDALGAGGLWQVALATTALQRGELPGASEAVLAGAAQGLVTSIGLNQQMAAAIVERR